MMVVRARGKSSACRARDWREPALAKLPPDAIQLKMEGYSDNHRAYHSSYLQRYSHRTMRHKILNSSLTLNESLISGESLPRRGERCQKDSWQKHFAEQADLRKTRRVEQPERCKRGAIP